MRGSKSKSKVSRYAKCVRVRVCRCENTKEREPSVDQLNKTGRVGDTAPGADEMGRFFFSSTFYFTSLYFTSEEGSAGGVMNIYFLIKNTTPIMCPCPSSIHPPGPPSLTIPHPRPTRPAQPGFYRGSESEERKAEYMRKEKKS